jgi:hypothetical protein
MEIAAIVTGIISVLAGFLPGLTPKRRALAILGGGGFAFYGIYVLNQTSGTWEFPIFLFLLPLFIISSAAQASLRHDEDS